MIRLYVLLGLIFLGTGKCYGKISLSFPQKNTVVQRDNNNVGRLRVGGTLSLPFEKLEARLVTLAGNETTIGAWTTLAVPDRQGTFFGSLDAQGGWYKLEIRGFLGGQVVDSASVQPVGIGEVFLVAGHSNAMGLPDLGAKDAVDQVVSFNALNKFLNNENITVAPDEPMPAPTFEPLKATNRIFPSGESAWYWGELGTLLVARLGVPVLFMNAGWAAANSVNWRETANGQNTRNIYVGKDWPNRQPYSNLINTLRYYHSWLGLRSVLWFHGENDAVHLKISRENYYQNIRRLIEKTNQDFGSTIGWTVALCSVSFNAPEPYAPVIEAQRQLADTPGLRVWRGPYGDTIQVPRPDHGHLENTRRGTQGLTQMAQAWNRSLSGDFFRQTPHTSGGFLLTGVVPRTVAPGQSFLLPYHAQGVNTARTEAQLLDQSGYFVGIVGAGSQSPLRVTLPPTLAEGSYRLRVVAHNPTQPGNNSELFRVQKGLATPELVKSMEACPGDDGRVELHALVAAHPELAQITVERSEDRETFQNVGDIPLHFNRGTSRLYGFTDTQPLPQTTYYRLRLRDRTGQIYYSSAIAVFQGDNPPPLAAFPNPAVSGEPIYLRLDLPQVFGYQLTDLRGIKIPADLSDSGIIGLPTLRVSPAVPPGIYLLQIKTTQTTRVQRIVIR